MKGLKRTAFCGVMALVSALAPGTGWAYDVSGYQKVACRSWIVGTYLTTIETVGDNSTGQFASRSLMTFHGDGTLTAVDARQLSGETGTAFSSQRGSYSCRGRYRAVATTLDFGFPPDGNIARFDLRIRIARDGSINGEMVLNLFTPLATCNPFEAEETCDPPDGPYRFDFSSLRVPSKAD